MKLHQWEISPIVESGRRGFLKTMGVFLVPGSVASILSACGGGESVNSALQNAEWPTLSTPSYSIKTLTNQDVVVTITSRENIDAPLGWTKSWTGEFAFINTYSANTTEAVVFKNAAGGTTSIPIEITNIDKVGPNISAPTYSSIVLSNQDNKVTITCAESIDAPLGWTKTKNGSNYDYSKTYSANTTEAVLFTDTVGNITTANVVISNIDKVAPVMSAPLYSTAATTNGVVVVTITGAENLTAPAGWTKTQNGSNYDYSKTYSANTTEAVVFSDNAGNTSVSNIAINNIDKTPPVLLAPSYSPLTPTSWSVTATVSSVENLSAPAGWTKSWSSPWLYTKSYSTNTTETVTFTDAAGNDTQTNVVVANIDTVLLTMSSLVYSNSAPTNGTVTASTTSIKDITAPTGWIKSGSGPYSFSKAYATNTNEIVVFGDSVWHSASLNVAISNIDTTGPALSAPAYSTVAPTNSNVVATVTTAEDIVAPTGWTKSGSGPFAFAKTYASNLSEAVVFSDIAGNTTVANITVNNIDTVGPAMSAPVYSTTASTGLSVGVTITSNEDIAAPAGWTKTPNGASYDFTKTYAANTTETVIFSDTLGNRTNVNIDVANIISFSLPTGSSLSVGKTTISMTVIIGTDPISVIINGGSHWLLNLTLNTIWWYDAYGEPIWYDMNGRSMFTYDDSAKQLTIENNSTWLFSNAEGGLSGKSVTFTLKDGLTYTYGFN